MPRAGAGSTTLFKIVKSLSICQSVVIFRDIIVCMKTVLITGTSRGIGKALAAKFLFEGYHVIGTSTSENNLSSHERFVSFQLDLSNEQSIQECAERVAKHNQKIDIFINNAGGLFDVEDNKIVMEKLKKVLK